MLEREISWRSPIDAFAPLAGLAGAHLLHAGDRRGDGWSIIVCNPSRVISARENTDSWFEEIQEVLDRRKATSKRGAQASGAPFCSGLIGFFGYEALCGSAARQTLPPSPFSFPDAKFGVYDAAIVFNRSEKRAFVVGRDQKSCREIEDVLCDGRATLAQKPDVTTLSSNFTRVAYKAAVRTVRERILDGEFYQANISQQLTVEFGDPVSGFDVFRLVARNSDANFGAILQYEEGAIVSNSPERFFQIELASESAASTAKKSRRIVVEPIKGTARRRGDAAADEQAAKSLVSSQKDRAENIMIADLMRNDLSRICEDGSIREEAICELMHLTRVHHLVSRISGSLRADKGFCDIIRALFPSGSITGAPKIASMNAIADIEKTGRGPYCGAIGYVDDSGAADFSVAIRTLMLDENGCKLTSPVGGGITLRSSPEDEYQETLAKAQSVLDAIGADGSLLP